MMQLLFMGRRPTIECGPSWGYLSGDGLRERRAEGPSPAGNGRRQEGRWPHRSCQGKKSRAWRSGDPSRSRPGPRVIYSPNCRSIAPPDDASQSHTRRKKALDSSHQFHGRDALPAAGPPRRGDDASVQWQVAPQLKQWDTNVYHSNRNCSHT